MDSDGSDRIGGTEGISNLRMTPVKWCRAKGRLRRAEEGSAQELHGGGDGIVPCVYDQELGLYCGKVLTALRC